MIDLQKEIIFRDGWTLDCGTQDITEQLLSNAGHVCDLGRGFGLSLDYFGIDSKMIYFDWRGTKYNMLRFYTYCSKNVVSESPKKRKAVLNIILGK